MDTISCKRIPTLTLEEALKATDHVCPFYTVLPVEPGYTHGTLSGAGLAPAWNWNDLYVGPRIETQAGNWGRERGCTVPCFSFEPCIKDS